MEGIPNGFPEKIDQTIKSVLYMSKVALPWSIWTGMKCTENQLNKGTLTHPNDHTDVARKKPIQESLKESRKDSLTESQEKLIKKSCEKSIKESLKIQEESPRYHSMNFSQKYLNECSNSGRNPQRNSWKTSPMESQKKKPWGILESWGNFLWYNPRKPTRNTLPPCQNHWRNPR